MLWSEGASRPGGADAGGRSMVIAFAAWREGHEGERHTKCLGLHARRDDSFAVWQSRVCWMAGQSRLNCAQERQAAMTSNAALMLEQRPPPCAEKEEQHVDDTWQADLFLQDLLPFSCPTKTARWSKPLLLKTA